MGQYDFKGWVTCANVKCTDGRVIMKDAFKHHDGQVVPLVWNHNFNDPSNILGRVRLEHHDEGIYGYGSFNDTESGQQAKRLVQHGDISALSICANQLKQNGSNVMHGMIREVSLVLAGANPKAYIETVMEHSSEGNEEAIIHSAEFIDGFYHDDEFYPLEFDEEGYVIEHNDEIDEDSLEHSEKKDDDETKEAKKENDKTVKEFLAELTEEQQNMVFALVGNALETKTKESEAEKSEDDEKVKHADSEGGNDMKQNAFDQTEIKENSTLSHADQENILKMAQASNCGSFREAYKRYSEQNSLKHGIDQIELLFPEYKDVKPGAPELVERDQTWVGEVMRKTTKSPFSRIRTRQADARGKDLRAKGYQNKGDEKTLSGNVKLMDRTTDPQTIYRKDSLHRDDIVDMTSFDVVAYMHNIMRHNMNEDIALATMVGDLREDGDPDKIKEEHIRPIWKDDELYTIHYDVDIEKMRTELQGSNTGANFGENYIFSEAVVNAALYSREKYKGSGNLEFYCTPHLLNVMLLARDLNGRRLYDSKVDLAKALNVSAIHTAEQFEGLTRTTKEGATKELLGLFVNLSDYQHGATKGGEITSFNQFDIDFNLEKYLLEARLSGALTRIKSAIALEIPVEEVAG